jgi:hypothetical protein
MLNPRILCPSTETTNESQYTLLWRQFLKGRLSSIEKRRCCAVRRRSMTGKQRARLSRALHDKAVTGMAVGSWVPSAVLALALVVLAPSIDVTQNPMQAVPFLAQCSSQPYLDDDGSTIRLGNDSLEIRFSKEAKGAIVGVENKVTGQQLVTNPAEALATWLIWDADDRWYGIWLAGSFSYEWKRMEDCSIELDLAWHNMDGAASSMVVHGRVILGESNLSRWRLSYEGAPGTFAPKAIAFPSVRGILPIGVSPRDDRYLVPETSGRLVHNPYEAMKGHGGYGVAGPGNTLNLQFVSLYEVDKGGFYLATEDTQGF